MKAKKRARTGRRQRPYLAVSLVALGLLGAMTAYLLWPRPLDPHPPEKSAPAAAPLPPLTESPFLNTRADVAYVGDQACADCHQDLCDAYHQHPMGRSLYQAADAPRIERYEQQTGNPFQEGRFHFEAVRQGDKLIHKEWCQDDSGAVVAELAAEIAYTIGAGSQARTYLVQHGDFLFESPITWYSERSAWGLSPGYAERQLHFTRRIDSRCLYCHTNEVHAVEHTINRYRDPPFGQLTIGCERCHGPGELHVEAQAGEPPAAKIDHTIVNPRHLATDLREAVCAQCHLQGEAAIPRRGRSQSDYRPGLPLHDFVSLFVRAPEVQDARRIVGHVEQMYESACFNQSGGWLGCTSCHDPHETPAADDKADFYRQRCQTCHSQDAPESAARCALPLARRLDKEGRDNCVACHMPRHPSSTATHLAVTDHRVLKDPKQPRELRSDFRPGDLPLLLFFGKSEIEPKEQSRDLALAAISLAEQAGAEGATPIRDYLAGYAAPRLEAATARDPSDVPAQEALGFAWLTLGRPREALQVLEIALAAAPDREQSLTWAADAAEAAGQFDRAEQLARRLVKAYPRHALNHERLAEQLAGRRAWPESLAAAETAVRINPFRAKSRELLIVALTRSGDQVRAKAEFKILGAIAPEHQAQFRPRFEALLGEIK